MAALEVLNMRVVFHARKPTSKERKKERFLSISRFFPEKKKFHSIPFVINKTRFYTHARIKHTHEIVLSARSTTGIVFELLLPRSSRLVSSLCVQLKRVPPTLTSYRTQTKERDRRRDKAHTHSSWRIRTSEKMVKIRKSNTRWSTLLRGA